MRILTTALLCAIALTLGGAAAWAEDGAESPAPKPVMTSFLLSHNIAPDGKPIDGVFKEEKGWRVTEFHGSGEVRVEDGVVYLEEGNDMTGVTWSGPLVRMNFEVTLEAKRVSGSDFFCGLTFPYGESSASFIVGGWGGTCVGISCLDYQDAYNNETARFMDFEMERWYRIRVRVTDKRIQAWIDDKAIVDVSTEDRHVDIRFEVGKSRPFGIATWRTAGAIRNVRFNALTEE
ncbi:MAG: DUF1080 domain-containing protein [Nitrospiraceae bacterium]|nr:DUF1080 domain-containing protein [Nitrospiraceae bacterium]